VGWRSALNGPSDSRRIGRFGTTLLGLLLLVLGAVLVTVLFSVWPTLERVSQSKSGPPQALFGFSISSGTSLIVLVIVASALGSYVHTATSFADYVGNGRLMLSWLWWYILRIFVGVALALLFYFAVRGGFFASQAANSSVNPFGIAALSGLVGLFSKQATDKLREVFDTLFRTAPGQGDEQRRDSIGNPRPKVVGVEPPIITAGSETATIQLRGEGFVPESQVRISQFGSDIVLERKSTFVASTELSVVLPKEDLEEACIFQVTVFNPEPGGGRSAPTRIEVRAETTPRNAEPGHPVTPPAEKRRGPGRWRPRRRRK
jgi:hypothetical protein